MMYRLALVLAWVVTLTPTLIRAEAPSASSLFDPARHMHVSEVKPGMSGYGLTVFKGTRIERFDVEVLSVLKNFNPKYDVVLIRCKGEYLEHTGSIAGMSGSPIFLRDEKGKFRMIGAFAYGWPLTKDPVAGVQPIEYMLRLPAARVASQTADAKEPEAGRDSKSGPEHAHGLSWSLADAGMVPFWKPVARPAASSTYETAVVDSESPVGGPSVRRLNGKELFENRTRALGGWSPAAGSRLGSDDPPRLEPLATPLMAGGLSPSLLKQIAPLFNSYGLTALQAGGGGSASPDVAPARLEPGSALAVPLLSGDVDLTAIGTVTEVLGDRVFAFGHPFNNEGAVSLPMGSGLIHAVIPNLQTSFKLGSLTKVRGRLNTDEAVGVAGQTGLDAPTIPIDFTVEYPGGQAPRTYHFNSAVHPKFTPMLAGVALAAAITGPSELPQYNTLDYDLKLEFANGQIVDIANTTTNASTQELFAEIGLPLAAAAENPFERVQVRKITGNVRISAEAREAHILAVNLPRSRYRPGETVKAFVTYKPFREPEGILPVELELPRDLPQGTYQLIISDAQRYFQDEQQSRPFRFTAETVKDVFGVLKDVAAIRMNAVYLRLLRQSDGVAVGRTALPQLPSSRRQILLGAGRSNTTPFVSSTTKSVPTNMVMDGSAEFAITIDPTAKVEVAGPKPAPKTEQPQPAAAPKPEEIHKTTTAEPPKEAQPKPQEKE